MRRSHHANSAASAAPGSGARMKASPTRKACTPASRMRCTSSRSRMPDSVTRSRSPGTRGSSAERRLQRDLERAQVAVVDAEQRRPQAQRAVEFAAVVHFHQHRQAERQRGGLQVRQLRIVEAGGDQQDAVGPQRTRLDDLVFVDHEILAQHRQRAGGTRLLQVGGRALEEARVGEHAQAGRTAGLVAGGDLGRHEMLAQHTLARARLLDLGDDGRPPGRDPRPQRGLEAAQAAPGLRRFGIGAPARQAAPGPGGGDFLALDGDDALQDVRHRPRPPPGTCC